MQNNSTTLLIEINNLEFVFDEIKKDEEYFAEYGKESKEETHDPTFPSIKVIRQEQEISITNRHEIKLIPAPTPPPIIQNYTSPNLNSRYGKECLVVNN